mgnify:CR=1 FL=1
MSLLSVEDLKTFYSTSKGKVHAVDGVSLDIEKGEISGLAGESGGGKTTILNSLIGVLPDNAEIVGGKILYKGRDLVELEPEEMQKVKWSEISVVPQSAMDALDPVMRVRDQFRLVARESDKNLSKKQVIERAEELFELVGLNKKRLSEYPHQFSGGMKQRAIIALALLFQPDLILLDEPVTALDVIVQNQILEHIQELQRSLHTSLLIVTHDISVLVKICDRIHVLYGGKKAESADTSDLIKDPLHPYTIGLQQSFPNLYEPEKELVSIPGNPPRLIDPPPGCRFSDRCPFSRQKCESKEPPSVEASAGHQVACFFHEKVARKREDAYRKEGQA